MGEESCTPAEMRKAFHALALKYHPDKQRQENAGMAGEAFLLVQQAYEEGLRVAAERTKGEIIKSGDTYDEDEVSLVPVSLFASKAVLKAALDKFERFYDMSMQPTMTYDIEQVLEEQVIEWLLEGRCLLVDTRAQEEKFGNMKENLPGALNLWYVELLKRPDTCQKVLRQLQSSAGEDKMVITYSTSGGLTTGQCTLVALILIDVFGFNPERVGALENGYLGYRRWAQKEPDIAERLKRMYPSVL